MVSDRSSSVMPVNVSRWFTVSENEERSSYARSWSAASGWSMDSWRKGRSSVSATSWESAVQTRPPASLRSRATASGSTAVAG